MPFVLEEDPEEVPADDYSDRTPLVDNRIHCLLPVWCYFSANIFVASPSHCILNLVGPIHIFGGGLAGCEAAWQIARAGLRLRAFRNAARASNARAQDRTGWPNWSAAIHSRANRKTPRPGC